MVQNQASSQYGEQRLQKARAALETVTAELERQKNIAGKAVADAAKMSPRISTQR